MATARPIRAMDPYAEQFWAYTLKNELRLQKCSDCGDRKSTRLNSSHT